jgi:integrase
VNGRRFYLGPHGTKASKLQYDRIVCEYLSSGRSMSFGTPEHQATIIELAADYLTYAKSYYGGGPTSELHRIARVVRPLKELYGKTAAADFGTQQFKAVRQRLIDEDCSRSFVNANMKRIVRMFRWAAGEGRISPTIPQSLAMIPSLRKGKTEARETDPVLPLHDLTIALTLVRLNAIVADMVRLQRLTGMRPGEVCMIRPRDIDRTGEVWEYRPESHKTQHRGKQRIIFIGRSGQEVLRPYLLRPAEWHCFRPCDSEAKRRAALHAARKTPLSCGNRPGTNKKRKPKRTPGESYNARSYHQAVRQACLKAGMRPWGPNRLRHSFATEVRRGHGLEATQVLLGHSKANITEVYAERDLAKGVEVARLIG